jgi:hypothetical protein
MDTAPNRTPADHVDQWLRFFANPNPAVQKRALPALLDSDDPRVISTLVDAFGEYGGYRGLLEAVTRRRDPAIVEPMLGYLNHPDHFIRAAACEVLGVLGDKRATLPLTARLEDSHMVVRRGAAFALANLRDARAADALLRRWYEHPDENINVKMGLAAALKALGIAYDRRRLFSSGAQPEVQARADHEEAAAVLPPETTRNETTSRLDLLYALATVARHLRSFVCDGKVQATNKEQELQSLRRLIDSHWKIGRSNGRKHRNQLRFLIWTICEIEGCLPFNATLLSKEEHEQARATLQHLKDIRDILNANEDSSPSIEQMRGHMSEVIRFLADVPWSLHFE